MSNWHNTELDDLDGYAFQNLVAELLSRMGFVVEVSAVGPDGGIDLLAHSSAAIVGGKYVVQCKRHTGTIPEHVVRDLYGVVRSEDAVKGILFTTSEFTLRSRKFAENKPLELIDGKTLRDLLAKHMPETGETLSDSGPWRVPMHFDLLCKQLNKLLRPTWEEWDGLRKGLVHVPPRRVDGLEAYCGIIGPHISELAQVIGTLEAVLGNLLKAASANETVLVAKQFASPVKRMLQMRRSATALSPPSWCEDLKLALHDLLDEQLLKVRQFHEKAVRPESWTCLTSGFCDDPQRRESISART